MRFEIKGGGFFAILLGIVALSSAVFIFGLLAGYDVGRQSASATAQVATNYSIPSAPLVTASAAPAARASVAAPPAVAANDNPTEGDSEDTTAKPVKGHAVPDASSGDEGEMSGEVPPPPDESTAPPSTSGAAQRTASADENSADDTADTGSSDEEAPPPKKHGFNIQIQAAMDLSGANQMIRRLKTIGYPAHMVATPIDGQTWYKVEVGPYPSQEGAAAAQATMRQKYNDAYGGHGGAAGGGSAAPPTASGGPGGTGAEE
jgi:septal ring-binding cell division protein DamX